MVSNMVFLVFRSFKTSCSILVCLDYALSVLAVYKTAAGLRVKSQ